MALDFVEAPLRMSTTYARRFANDIGLLPSQQVSSLILEGLHIAMPRRILDWISLVFCNVIWGSQFVVYKLVQHQVGPLFASLFPITCATVFVLIFMLLCRKKTISSTYARKGIARDVRQFIIIGIFGQVAAQLGVAWGSRLIPASNAALLALMLPIATAFMAYLFLGERMTPSRWIGFGLAIVGVLECSGIQWNRLDATSPNALLGNCILLCAVSGSAFYNAYSKRLLIRFSPLEVLFYSYCVVIVTTLPITFYFESYSFRNIPHFTISVWVGFVILSFFQYFLAMVIFLGVLTRLDATQAGLSNYLMPFFGVLIAAVYLGEHLTTYMVIGGMMVLLATVIVTFRGSRGELHKTQQSAKEA